MSGIRPDKLNALYKASPNYRKNIWRKYNSEINQVTIRPASERDSDDITSIANRLLSDMGSRVDSALTLGDDFAAIANKSVSENKDRKLDLISILRQLLVSAQETVVPRESIVVSSELDEPSMKSTQSSLNANGRRFLEQSPPLLAESKEAESAVIRTKAEALDEEIGIDDISVSVDESMNLADQISSDEISRFSEFRQRFNNPSTRDGFVRGLIRGKQHDASLEFLDSLSDRHPTTQFLEAQYSKRKAGFGTSLEVQFQQDIQQIKNNFEHEISVAFSIDPDLASSAGVTATDRQLMDFVAKLPGSEFKGLSIKDKIHTCFSLCDQQYKENKTIPAAFKPFVALLKVDMGSAFVKSHSRTTPTFTVTHDGNQYLKKSGLHEFVKVEHRVENFLMSIGQHPDKTAWGDYSPHVETTVDGELHKLSFNDVYTSLQVDTASLMFYQLDASENKIIDDATGEVEITGGGHPGAALDKRDDIRLAERIDDAEKKGQSEVSAAVQSVDGSDRFHKDLSVAFFNSATPGELVGNLYDMFCKHCFDGERRPKQITDGRILHVSGHRLHTHSKTARSSFSKEMVDKFKINIGVFKDLFDVLGMDYLDNRTERTLSDSSGGSKGSDKSGPETYFIKQPVK